MTTKSVFICILLLSFIPLSFGQAKERNKSTFFYDADSICLGVFYKTNNKIDSTFYWDLNKKKNNVCFILPEFKFEVDSLNNLLLNKFRERLNFTEVNGAALVYILLDNKKIKEIRIGKRIGYDSKYDESIKETLMLTQGNWIIPENVDKPLLFVYLFKMR